MDSISIMFKTKQINTTTVIEKQATTSKQPLLTITPSVTAGYDIINHKWGVMAGISLNLNIKPKRR